MFSRTKSSIFRSLYKELSRKNFNQKPNYCSVPCSPDPVSYTQRTTTCGSLRQTDVGKTVRLCGWLQYQRQEKFLVLRDSHGLTQMIVPKDKIDMRRMLKTLSYESVLQVEGRVIPRPDGQANLTCLPGDRD